MIAIDRLRRHQLVWLNEAGWATLKSLRCDDVAGTCLAHWASRQLPLVVTQQGAALPPGQVALGLPAPLQWQRRRIALQVPWHHVLRAGEFPQATSVNSLLPSEVRSAWMSLAGALEGAGVAARVHGSFGWQQLTGLGYLHAASDLDLHVAVGDAAKADMATLLLSRASFTAPRLDGEIVFPDGTAVAWREWQPWRLRRVDRILVKRLTGVAMATGATWLGERQMC